MCAVLTSVNSNNNISIWELGKRIFSLALPMAGTQFINVASVFLCMAMLAQLGHELLAASALIFLAQMAVMATGTSILFSLSVLVGHAYGAKNYSTVGNYVQQGWMLGMLIAIPIIIIFWYIDVILLFFGQEKEVVSLVRLYFRAYVWGVIPGVLATCNQLFGYAIHKKSLIVYGSCLAAGVLLATAYILVFGKYGAPQLGVAGLGYAMAAQYGFFFVFTLLFFYYDNSFDCFELFKYRAQQHWEHFIEMFKIGWPISVQAGGGMLSFLVSGIMVGWLGTVALAAYQVMNQYYFLIAIPMFSLSQASGILIGHACGAKQYHEVRKLSYASMAMVLAVSMVVAIVFLLFPAWLASFYIDVRDPANAATLHLVVLLFMIMAFFQVFDGLRNVLMGVLRGLFDTRLPMYISLLTIWLIGMPLSYILAFSFQLGAVGFVVGCLLGMFAGAAVLMYRWRTLMVKFSTPI